MPTTYQQKGHKVDLKVDGSQIQMRKQRESKPSQVPFNFVTIQVHYLSDSINKQKSNPWKVKTKMGIEKSKLNHCNQVEVFSHTENWGERRTKNEYLEGGIRENCAKVMTDFINAEGPVQMQNIRNHHRNMNGRRQDAVKMGFGQNQEKSNDKTMITSGCENS